MAAEHLAENGGREENPCVHGETPPPDCLFRARLRVLVWPWPLFTLGLAPGTIIGFGPFLAALVVLALIRGKVGVIELLKRMVRWRVRPVWYTAALLLPTARLPVPAGSHTPKPFSFLSP